MEQWLLIGCSIEVTRLAFQGKIDDVSGTRRHVFAEGAKLMREQIVPSEEKRDGEDRDKRRKEPPDAPGVERGDREAILRNLAEDNRGDQEARNDKKDIDTGKSSGDYCRRRMISDDSKNRDGT